MLIHSVADLGQLIRQKRTSLDITQADLAKRIKASRKWIMDLEAGKPTVALDRVMRALHALGLLVDVRPPNPVPAGYQRQEMESDYFAAVDLDALIVDSQRPPT